MRHLHLAAGHVEVRQTLARIDAEWRGSAPKSARSSRNVPLVERSLVRDLRAHLVAHPNSGGPGALLRLGRVSGSHLVTLDRVLATGSMLRNYFRPAVAGEGLQQMRLHDLRHTFASRMLAADFPPYEVSRWLGHANVARTDAIYAHLYPSDYSGHVDRFSAFVAGAR